jgi:hypothetical protein
MGHREGARRFCRRATPAALAIIGLLLAGRADAQIATLTLSGSTLTAATPTVADYLAGYVCLGSITATVTTTGEAKTARDSVFIRLLTAVDFPVSPATGTAKKIADFMWSTNAAGCSASASAWASVPASTAIPAMIGASTSNTGLVATVYFRLALTWKLDAAPFTYTLPGVKFFVNRSATNPP